MSCRKDHIPKLKGFLEEIEKIRTLLIEEERKLKLSKTELEDYKPIDEKDTFLEQQGSNDEQTGNIKTKLDKLVVSLKRTIDPPTLDKLRSSSSGPIEGGLRVAYLNVNAAENKKHVIRYLLLRYDLDVLFLGEAKLTKNFKAGQSVYENFKKTVKTDDMRIDGYALQREDRRLRGPGQGGGGVLAYIKDGVGYEVIESYTAAGEHPLQYIYLRLKSEKVHLVGVYLPPNTPRQRDVLVELLERFADQDNIVIMGDININYIDKDYPLSQIESRFGYTQLINNYTRVEVQKKSTTTKSTEATKATAEGTGATKGTEASKGTEATTATHSLTETLIDHIYKKNSQVLESGVVRCGISDHALIYCTLESSNLKREQASDILRHDVPLIVSNILSGQDNYLTENLRVQDPGFWLMAGEMETRWLKLKNLVAANEIGGLDILSKVSDFISADGGSSSTKKEFGRWKKELGQNMNGTYFFSEEQLLFRFCFPSLCSSVPDTAFKIANIWPEL